MQHIHLCILRMQAGRVSGFEAPPSVSPHPLSGPAPPWRWSRLTSSGREDARAVHAQADATILQELLL